MALRTLPCPFCIVRMSCKILKFFSVEHFHHPNIAGWNIQNKTSQYILFLVKLLQTCARANLNKAENFMTNIIAASKYEAEKLH